MKNAKDDDFVCFTCLQVDSGFPRWLRRCQGCGLTDVPVVWGMSLGELSSDWLLPGSLKVTGSLEVLKASLRGFRL